MPGTRFIPNRDVKLVEWITQHKQVLLIVMIILIYDMTVLCPPITHIAKADHIPHPHVFEHFVDERACNFHRSWSIIRNEICASISPQRQVEWRQTISNTTLMR